jgi:uncharacterized Zn-finger protein
VNARTVLKVREKEEPLVFVCSRILDEDDGVEANHQIQKEEEEEEEEEEEGVDEDVERLRRIMCVPCDDVVEQNHQMREEETAFIAKGVKRKRGHECDVCEKVFRYPSHLATHMLIHTNETPYECNVCEKRFTQAGNLKRHMRIHTNERPYECDVCDEAFRQRDTLKTRMRMHTNARNRTSLLFAIKLFVNLLICKNTRVLNVSSFVPGTSCTHALQV